MKSSLPSVKVSPANYFIICKVLQNTIDLEAHGDLKSKYISHSKHSTIQTLDSASMVRQTGVDKSKWHPSVCSAINMGIMKRFRLTIFRVFVFGEFFWAHYQQTGDIRRCGVSASRLTS